MAEPRRFLIGYALAPKKQQSFIQPSLLSVARERGIDLVPIDAARPLSDQGPFDCVLHKLYGDDWKAQLYDFGVKNTSVPIIDPPDAIEPLQNRMSMLQVVSELNNLHNDQTLGIPRQVVVQDRVALLDAIDVLSFPVIAKPLDANGSENSHNMSLVYRRDGLLRLQTPVVLQEFVNHGGVIFKVYVVGDYVKCVKRMSLPDVCLEDFEGSDGLLSFSQISNMGMQKGTEGSMHLEEVELPPLSFVTDLALGLRRAMRLHLFNFDIIRDSNARNHYLVIDINYFPGYAKIPCYERVLTDFLLSIVKSN